LKKEQPFTIPLFHDSIIPNENRFPSWTLAGGWPAVFTTRHNRPTFADYTANPFFPRSDLLFYALFNPVPHLDGKAGVVHPIAQTFSSQTV
jgi:hypothetical protein